MGYKEEIYCPENLKHKDGKVFMIVYSRPQTFPEDSVIEKIDKSFNQCRKRQIYWRDKFYLLTPESKRSFSISTELVSTGAVTTHLEI